LQRNCPVPLAGIRHAENQQFGIASDRNGYKSAHRDPENNHGHNRGFESSQAS